MRLLNTMIIALSLILFGGCGSKTEEGKDTVNDRETGDQIQESPEPATRDQTSNPNTNQLSPQENIPSASSADISDKKLIKFLEVNQKVQLINQSAQQGMMKALQNQGLDVGRYAEIQESIQNPNVEPNASPEEMKQFQEVNAEMQKLQSDVQLKMQGIFDESGVTQQEMQNLSMQIQNDQELMQRFQMLQQQQSGNGNAQ